MITIVDYGAGNLTSVKWAVEELGFEVEVTADPLRILGAAKVIFPGVGAAGQAMEELAKRGLIESIRAVVAKGTPFLGICLGMQILFDWSDEDGGIKCLGLLAGKVKRFDFGSNLAQLKVPHMGWNQVRQTGLEASGLWQGIGNESNFYFVHSFYCEPVDKALVIGETEYGGVFTAAVQQKNVIATQFHPEKSGRVGLRFLQNFCQGDYGGRFTR